MSFKVHRSTVLLLLQADPGASCLLEAPNILSMDSPEPTSLPEPLATWGQSFEATRLTEHIRGLKPTPAVAVLSSLRKGGPCREERSRKEERAGLRAGPGGDKPLMVAASDLPLLPANPKSQQCEI